MNALLVLGHEDDLQLITRQVKDDLSDVSKLYVTSMFVMGNENWLFDSDIEFIPINLNKYIDFENAQGMIKKYNQCVKNAGVSASWVYEMGYQIEGGYQQIIHDFLMHINWLIEVISKKSINTIYYSSGLFLEEIEAITCICRQQGIRCQEIRNSRSLGYFIRNSKRYILSNKRIRRFVYSIFNRVNIYSNILKIRLRNKNEYYKRSVDVALVTNFITGKHVAWDIRTLNKIESDISIHCYTFGNDIYNKEYEKYGYETTSAETYSHICDFFIDTILWYSEAKKIKYQIYNIPQIVYRGIDVTSDIRNRFLDYLYCQTLLDFANNILMKRVLCYNHMRSAFIRGDSNFTLNRILYYVYLNEYGSELRIIKDDTVAPFIYEQQLPQAPYCNIIDSIFVPVNSSHLYRKMNNWNGKVYEACVFDEEKTEFNNVSLLKHSFDYLWAPSNILPGYSDYTIAGLVSDIVFGFFAKSGDRLRVKYHPAEKQEYIKDYVNRYNQFSNIEFIDQSDSIEKMIDSSDVIITTVSTVIFDALRKGKIVIVIIDAEPEREYDPKALRDLLIIHASELESILKKIDNACKVNDKNGYIADILRRQKEYYDYLYCEGAFLKIGREIIFGNT